MIQDTGLKRKSNIDKFYTKREIAKECIELFYKYIKIDNNDIIIEPSAGSGAFLDLKHKYLAYDILPESDKIIEQDFLTLKLDPNKIYHFLGNPPFGRQSSLAKRFIKKSCKYGSSVSYILPKSFKKESNKKVFDLNFHLIFEKDLDKNSFMINNREYDIPCVFQIWVKKKEKRIVPKKEIEKGFKYVKKTNKPDFSIRRVGINAGKISTDILDKSIQSHYFIILDKKNKEEFLILYENNFDFDFNNTVGPRSISKPELNKYVNFVISKMI